jgi:uncharacterized protein (DUF2147 family)
MVRRLMLLVLVVAAQTHAADGGVDLTGDWAMPEREAVVRFTQADGGWNGVIVATPRAGEKGLTLFRELREVRAGELEGTLVMPENGSSHGATVRLEGGRLKAKVGAFLFTKTLTLERRK